MGKEKETEKRDKRENNWNLKAGKSEQMMERQRKGRV